MSEEKQIKEACARFCLRGEYRYYEVVNSGHINTTYRVYYLREGELKDYIVQKVNTYVFQNPEAVMENIASVTEFIREQIKDYHSDYDKLYYSDFYRLFNTGDSVAYNRVSYDKSYAEVIFVRLFKHAYAPLTYLKVKGLDANAMYKVNGKEVYSGDTLMKFGIPLARGDAEYTYAIYKLEKVN
jgi:hypothetical protein